MAVMINITGLTNAGGFDQGARHVIRERLIALFSQRGESDVFVHFLREDKSTPRNTPVVAQVASVDFNSMPAWLQEALAIEIHEVMELAGHSIAYVFLLPALAVTGRKNPKFD